MTRLEGLGALLRQARLRQNLSLDDAEQATKIRRAFLEALEEERWDRLPARAYAQGLLTVYARTLGLDPTPLVTLLPPEERETPVAPEYEIPVGRAFPFKLLAVVIVMLALLIAGGYALREVLAGGLPFFSEGFATSTPEPATATRASSIAVVTPTAVPGVSVTAAATSAATSTGPTPAGATSTAAAATATPVRTGTPAATPSPAATATPAGTATPAATATPAVTTAPALVGRPWPQVVEQLQAAGITPVRQEQVSETVPQEQVIAQTPAAGQPLNAERTITVVVSLGRAGITVPDVVGRPEAEARTLLTQAGLVPGRFANYQGRGDVPEAVLRSVCVGCVLSTSPGAGSVQPQGTTVLLAVRKD